MSRQSIANPTSRATQRRLLLLMPWLLTATVASGHEPVNEESSQQLFNLSLDDLLQLRVTGAAVRDLGLDTPAATGNPFSFHIAELPVSVETIDHDTMQARGLGNVVEAAENLIGVLSGDSPAEPHSFSMRGFSRDSVNVLYDGVSMGLATLNMRPQGTYNLDRLEIVKGAATLQHGQGAAGGTINLISRKPVIGTASVSEVILGYGSYDSTELSAGLTGPVGEHSAYRLDFNHTASNGWVDHGDSESLNLNGALAWQLAPDVLLTLSLNALSDTLPAYWGTPLVPRTVARDPLGGVVSTRDDRVLDAATRFNNYNVADHVIDSESLWLRADLAWSVSARSALTASVYQFDADRSWRNAESYSYNATTGLVERDRLLVDHDRDLTGMRAGWLHHGDIGGHLNHFSINVEYSDNDFARTVGFDIDNPEPFVDAVDLYEPQPGVFGEVDLRPDSLRNQITAIVLEDALDLTDSLRLDIAARFEQAELDRRRYTFAGTPVPRTTLAKTFDQSSFRIGLLQQFGEQFSGYAHYSQQHDPIEGDITSVFFANVFVPSDVEQVEVGLSAWLDDKQTELTLAWFDLQKDLTQQRPDLSFVDSAQNSTGVEFAIRSQFGEQFRIGGNLTHIDASYDAYYDANAGVDVDGKTPTNVPEWMAGLWASFDGVGGWPVEIGAGAQYVSDRFADSANTVTLQEYTLLSAFVAYSQKRYRVALNIRNATDEIYSPWADQTYPNQISLGAPRTVDLSLQVKF